MSYSYVNESRGQVRVIRGCESTKTIFEQKVKYGVFGEQQIKTLLMVLAGRDLQLEEIFCACASKRSNIHNDLLAVEHHATKSVYMYTCGRGTRSFTAEIAEREERQARIAKTMGQEA